MLLTQSGATVPTIAQNLSQPLTTSNAMRRRSGKRCRIAWAAEASCSRVVLLEFMASALYPNLGIDKTVPVPALILILA